MAAPAGTLPDPYTLALFGTGSFIMRGAGCTINDLWDQDIDKMVKLRSNISTLNVITLIIKNLCHQVPRTKDRPLVINQITMKQSLIFLMGQLSLGLLILLQLNWYSVFLGASSLGTVRVIYTRKFIYNSIRIPL